jgi:hypothetical protein
MRNRLVIVKCRKLTVGLNKKHFVTNHLLSSLKLQSNQLHNKVDIQ